MSFNQFTFISSVLEFHGVLQYGQFVNRSAIILTYNQSKFVLSTPGRYGISSSADLALMI